MTEPQKVYKKRDLEDYTYDFICDEALQAQQKFNLNTFQTNIYNHLCQGDFALRNGNGQMFFDPESGGMGHEHDRNWVESHIRPLLKHGLVKIKKGVRDCNGAQYTSWYFYDPRYDLENLISDWLTSPYGAKAQKFIKRNKYKIDIIVSSVDVFGDDSPEANSIVSAQYQYLVGKRLSLVFNVMPSCWEYCCVFDERGKQIKINAFQEMFHTGFSLRDQCYTSTERLSSASLARCFQICFTYIDTENF